MQELILPPLARNTAKTSGSLGLFFVFFFFSHPLLSNELPLQRAELKSTSAES